MYLLPDHSKHSPMLLHSWQVSSKLWIWGNQYVCLHSTFKDRIHKCLHPYEVPYLYASSLMIIFSIKNAFPQTSSILLPRRYLIHPVYLQHLMVAPQFKSYWPFVSFLFPQVSRPQFRTITHALHDALHAQWLALSWSTTDGIAWVKSIHFVKCSLCLIGAILLLDLPSQPKLIGGWRHVPRTATNVPVCCIYSLRSC